MLSLKNFLCTCVLALIVFSSLHGQAREEIYHLTRLHIVPGQERAFIMANAAYAENRPERTVEGWTTYVFSDHSVGITVSAADLPDPENRGSNRDFTTNFIPNSNLVVSKMEPFNTKVTDPTIAGREEHVLRYRTDLSYTPEPAWPGRISDPVPYYEIVTYRVKPGQLDKVLKMSRNLVDMMEMMESPLAFQFYSRDPAGKMNEFEIAFPAEGADDLAERRAAHTADRSFAVMRWEADMPLYAERIRTITGRYVAEMSDSIKTVSLNERR